jgi:8-amino-7-oxononanoate synthase
MPPVSLYQTYCSELQRTQKYRQLPEINKEKKSLLDFSSNDYLGLSSCPSVLHASYDAGKKYGVGSTGARLLSGNSYLFEEFECQIAKDKGLEKALILNSGYQANISVLSALCDKTILKQQALVFSDRLNHASLMQGIFLSDAHLIRYRHNTLADLEALLQKYQEDSRPKFIVSETIFGMDGDIAPLQELVALAKKFSAFLYLDEAHATGILGLRGYGLSTTVDLSGIPHIVMGTFSKGIGVCGAYVAGPALIISYLMNRAAGFIYSTALSPLVVGAAFEAWKIAGTLEKERVTLQKRANTLRNHLRARGINAGLSSTHIIPLIIGDEGKTITLQQTLKNHGILTSAVRPPTVPPGTSRLRIALTTSHTDEDIQRLLTTLEAIL